MSEINLTPPEAEPTLTDMLEDLSVDIVWNKEEKIWQFEGLVTDWHTETPSLGTLLADEDADKLLTSRDRDTVLRIVNEDVLPGDLELAEELWTDIFNYYGDHPYRGPSINVKLHATYDFWRAMEKGLGVELPEEPEIDPHGMIWNDTIDWEWDYYMETLIPMDHPALDTDRFVRLGRSGGHLVYDVRHGLSVPEAWDFMQLEKEAPKYVKYVAAEVVRNLAGHALFEMWERELEDWEDRESEAVAEAIRMNNFKAARRHQANLDAVKGQEFFPLYEAQDLAWEAIQEYVDEAVSE